MSTLGFCIVAYNEDEVFEKSLASIVEVADEIVIVFEPDTNQNTIDIGKKYTDKIYYNKLEDWSTSFNHANKMTHTDYLINWDADFVLRPSSIPYLKKLKAQDFHSLNSVVLHWNIEFSSDYKSPLTWVKRKLIHKKGEYYFAHPLHPRHVFNPQKQEKIGYYPDIQIDHYNTYKGRKPRYERFLAIMKKLVTENPDDAESLFYYGEELIFANNYDEAYRVFKHYLNLYQSDPLNRLVYAINHFCHTCIALGKAKAAIEVLNKFNQEFSGKSAIYDLILCDVLLANDKIDECVAAYQSFIKHYSTQKNTDVFDLSDHYRLKVYPYFILAKIYKITGKDTLSKQHAAQANQANKDPKRTPQIQELL
jgi:tetratricopeptide (TPR) repeat protein